MISFDLKCRNGHVFEAWFGSSADYEAQREKGLVSCPICNDKEIGKALMAPAVQTGRQGTTAAEAKEMLANLAHMQARLEADCDYVGDRFVVEARRRHAAMHREKPAKRIRQEKREKEKDEKEKRGIIGNASPDEARALLEDGISVLPLPFRLRRDSDA